ncbi:MAG: cysteine--tRNA ligase, partial [Planctomycetota bacterium]
VAFDGVKNYLRFSGYDVTFVVNITDVDDKLIAKSQERGLPMSQIAIEMTADYMANLQALNVTQIDYMPRATDHMGNIIDFIVDLEKKGIAYAADGDVFFDVNKDPNYGQLSNRSLDQQQGAGGEAASKKRNAGDFALWKSAKTADEPAWDSPWGRGRPGWHIECSAMSRSLLGETFDIHGGGLDLMFPHHENELAQSGCCHSAPMVKYWMHNGLMRRPAKGKLGGRSDREDDTPQDIEAQTAGKISRSNKDGGLAALIRRVTGQRLRFFLLRTQYRSTIVFDDEGLDEAGTALDSFYRLIDRYAEITGDEENTFYDLTPVRLRSDLSNAADDETSQAIQALTNKFLASMDDDFNTGGAISALFDMVRTINRYLDANDIGPGSQADAVTQFAFGRLRTLSEVLGLFSAPPIAAAEGGDDDLADGLMQLLIDLRKTARANKDFATGDAIRDRLKDLGVALLDKKEGTSWERS